MLSMRVKTQYLFGPDHELFKRWLEEESGLGFIEINETLQHSSCSVTSQSKFSVNHMSFHSLLRRGIGVNYQILLSL